MTSSTATDSLTVRRGFSCLSDEIQAVQELYDSIYQPDMAAVVVFCSSKYNLNKLGDSLRERFTVPIIGCTTSGEITPSGYREGSITGFSLTSDRLQVETYTINSLDNLDIARIRDIGESVKSDLSARQAKDADTRAFALFLIDGLSVMEETVVANLYRSLGNIPIVGGSAGDDIAFSKTHVFADGQFVSNAAVVALFTTSLPFRTFKTQHFEPTDTKLVITEADPRRRIVKEINGQPAALEYARLAGVRPGELGPETFSKYPVMLRIGGEYYVRSIQKVNDDRSLTFYCAIDEGLVLTLARGVDLVNNLEESLTQVDHLVSNPQLIIGCECILRRLEVIDKDLTREVDQVMGRHNVVGFHTYGEQLDSIHINQTFTGVVIGS